MADRTNDERLRELTAIAARARARIEEIKRLRAELLAARAEVERMRADLREAMELLRWASPDMDNASWDEWGGRANLLLVKHKEAADG